MFEKFVTAAILLVWTGLYWGFWYTVVALVSGDFGWAGKFGSFENWERALVIVPAVPIFFWFVIATIGLIATVLGGRSFKRRYF